MPDSRQDEASLVLYQTMLGDAWAALPAPIKAMHSCRSQLVAEGLAEVERGSGMLSRIVGMLFRFPAAGINLPVRVVFTKESGGELWQRTFAGKSFASFQSAGKGRCAGLLAERFGPFDFGLELSVREGQVHLAVRRWSILGLPLPLWLAPRGDSYEHVQDGKFCFHVEIRHILLGLIVRYRGWLSIVADQ